MVADVSENCVFPEMHYPNISPRRLSKNTNNTKWLAFRRRLALTSRTENRNADPSTKTFGLYQFSQVTSTADGLQSNKPFVSGISVPDRCLNKYRAEQNKQ
jgi:hypothetical protein